MGQDKNDIINMGVITIDRDDFTKGASTADGLADGGFSPLSKGIRPVVADYTGSNHFNFLSKYSRLTLTLFSLPYLIISAVA